MHYIIVFWLNGHEHALPASSLAPMVELARRNLTPQAWRDGLRVA